MTAAIGTNVAVVAAAVVETVGTEIITVVADPLRRITKRAIVVVVLIVEAMIGPAHDLTHLVSN